MKTLYSIALGLTALFFISCESATYQEVSVATTDPTYNAHIKPVIENNCVSCHNPDYGQEPYLLTYEAVKDETLNGDLLCRIDDQSCGSVMPTTGRMPQAKIDLIRYWKEDGCPEN